MCHPAARPAPGVGPAPPAPGGGKRQADTIGPQGM